MNRRETLRLMGGALAWTAVRGSDWATGAETVKRTGLGLVTYACGLRQQAEKRKNPKSDLFEPLTFLEHGHRLGAGGVQVPLGIRDEAYSAKLRGKAEQHGMFLEGNTNPPRDRADLDRFEAEMRTAARAGARAVRTVIVPGRRYEYFDSFDNFREAVERGRKSLELAAPIMEKHRVPLAVENHKEQRVADRVALLKGIGSEFVGACVDAGNSFALLEDPIEVVEALAPWAFSVHLKDQAVRECDDGFLFADVPLGQGFLDLKRMVAILRRARPQVCFSLESITRDPLRIPCLTEKYWAAMADAPGRDLARTLRTVRARQAATLPAISSLPPDAQVAQENSTVSQSLAYARDQLGL